MPTHQTYNAMVYSTLHKRNRIEIDHEFSPLPAAATKWFTVGYERNQPQTFAPGQIAATKWFTARYSGQRKNHLTTPEKWVNSLTLNKIGVFWEVCNVPRVTA